MKLSEIDKQIVAVSYSHLKLAQSTSGTSQLEHYTVPHNSFNIFSPIPNAKRKDEKRLVFFEVDEVSMKDFENKTQEVVIKILTDCMLICSVIKSPYGTGLINLLVRLAIL